MPAIALTGVSKTYPAGGRPAVDGLTLDIADGSFTCLLGPSGCGKTTTLRMIAGLEHPTAGAISVGGRILDSLEQGVFVPAERRGMGLVFQNYALWPHLTVARNVEFGLRVRRLPAPERERKVREALELMQIGWAAERYPAQLSGGQQQRVSLARMLAVEPQVLLLDEPLSNLDARLRLEMRAELKRLHTERGYTIVLVTHDQLEAMTMATHVAVLSDGLLQQHAAPMEVYARPANVFVAQFVGSPPMNLVPLGEPTPLAEALRAYLAKVAPGVADESGHVGVRPQAVRLTHGAAPPAGAWTFDATVSAVLPAGSSWTVSLTVGGADLYLVSAEEVTAAPGARVGCAVRAEDLHLFGRDGARLEAWDRRAQSAGVGA